MGRQIYASLRKQGKEFEVKRMKEAFDKLIWEKWLEHRLTLHGLAGRLPLPDRPGHPGANESGGIRNRQRGQGHPTAGRRKIPAGSCSGIMLDISQEVW